jgi:hypothetical protein
MPAEFYKAGTDLRAAGAECTLEAISSYFSKLRDRRPKRNRIGQPVKALDVFDMIK